MCVELEAREPAIKKRTGTSKSSEAQTQHTCWQSIGKPGEVKLERERKRERRREREEEGGGGQGECMWERREPERRGRAQTQPAHTHTHTPSPLPSLWSKRARGSMCE